MSASQWPDFVTYIMSPSLLCFFRLFPEEDKVNAQVQPIKGLRALLVPEAILKETGAHHNHGAAIWNLSQPESTVSFQGHQSLDNMPFFFWCHHHLYHTW